MKEPKIERSIILYVWIYALIVCVSLFFIFHFDYIMPISFLLGTATSLLCFTMTIKTVDKVIKYDDERKKSAFVKNNIYKYLVYLAVLGVAGFSYYRHTQDTERLRYLNVFAVAAGFFSVKIMIYFKIFIIDKIFKKKAQEDYADEVVTEEEHLKFEEMRKKLDEEEQNQPEKKNKYLEALKEGDDIDDTKDDNS